MTPPGDRSGRGWLGTAQRIVVKVGSSSLTRDGGGIDAGRLESLVDALAAGRGAGREVVLVSSGAIALGASGSFPSR